jgi:ubiquinone/menaquinone biosynthesis C-methylase UbiE
MVSQMLARMGSRSPWVRRSLWRTWYGFLAGRYRQPEWKFMNYGYAAVMPETPPLSLEPADEPDRYSIQLYHHVARGADLRGKAVLEVGCGRGGGCAYLARYLRPRSVLGVDYSQQAIDFCTRTHSAPTLSFLQGDAEALPCSKGMFDVVLNVESSHCYGSMPAFLAEVHRVLKPGGHLLWADLRANEVIGETHAQFEDAGFVLLHQKLITPNVLRSLDLISDGRAEMIRRLAPRILAPYLRDFAGVPGTRVYECLRTGAVEYVSCVLRKPEAQ